MTEIEVNRRILDTEEISEIETLYKGQIENDQHEDIFHTLWHYKVLVASQKEEIAKLNEVIRTLGLSLQNTRLEGKNK